MERRFWETEHNPTRKIERWYPPVASSAKNNPLEEEQEPSIDIDLKKTAALVIGCLALTAASLTWLAVDRESAVAAVLFYTSFIITCAAAVPIINKAIQVNVAIEKSRAQEETNQSLPKIQE